MCDPQEFFADPDSRKTVVGEINTVLAFNNLKMDQCVLCSQLVNSKLM